MCNIIDIPVYCVNTIILPPGMLNDPGILNVTRVAPINKNYIDNAYKICDKKEWKKMSKKKKIFWLNNNNVIRKIYEDKCDCALIINDNLQDFLKYKTKSLSCLATELKERNIIILTQNSNTEIIPDETIEYATQPIHAYIIKYETAKNIIENNELMTISWLHNQRDIICCTSKPYFATLINTKWEKYYEVCLFFDKIYCHFTSKHNTREKNECIDFEKILCRQESIIYFDESFVQMEVLNRILSNAKEKKLRRAVIYGRAARIKSIFFDVMTTIINIVMQYDIIYLNVTNDVELKFCKKIYGKNNINIYEYSTQAYTVNINVIMDIENVVILSMNCIDILHREMNKQKCTYISLPKINCIGTDRTSHLEEIASYKIYYVKSSMFSEKKLIRTCIG